MSGPIDVVRSGFTSAGIPAELTDELLEAFAEVKRRFYLSDHGPGAVYGGRFSEAVYRILQWQTDGGSYIALGKMLPSVDALNTKLENSGAVDSIRLHIPRTLKLIYDIRNKRNTAHLGDGIDPNLQDASLVVANMDWVLAELVRLYHQLSPGEAQKIIEVLIAREVPVIQEFDGFPLILKDLPAAQYVLVLLYWAHPDGVTSADLTAWVKPPMRTNLRRTVASLETKLLVFNDDKGTDPPRFKLTYKGEREVVRLRLVEPG